MGTYKMAASPSGPSLGNIPGKLLCSSPDGIRGKGQSNKYLGVWELKISLGCHQVYPWCLHDRTGRDEYTACVSKGQTKSDQGKKALVQSLLHPHLKQGGMPPVERSHGCRCRFVLSYAAAAQWPQSCLTLCDPIVGSPPGSSIPGTLQERILEWVAISFSLSLSHRWELTVPEPLL